MLRPSKTNNVKETRKIINSPNTIKKRDSTEAFINAKKMRIKGFFRQMAFWGAPRSIGLLWDCAGKACSENEVGSPHLITQVGTPLCPLQALA